MGSTARTGKQFGHIGQKFKELEFCIIVKVFFSVFPQMSSLFLRMCVYSVAGDKKNTKISFCLVSQKRHRWWLSWMRVEM